MTLEQFLDTYHLSLDAQQRAAAGTKDGPVLLLAVPGSGKTTVLIARLGYLIYGCGIAPEKILTVTYTVSAAQDMRARFTRFFGPELAPRLSFFTINGLCSRVIRRCEQLYGRPAFQLLEDSGRQAAMLSEIYRGIAGDFPSESTIKSLQTHITYVKNAMLDPQALESYQPEDISDFPELYRAYTARMRALRLMDYDDQLLYAYRLLQKSPELLGELRARWRYLCVDEAQDTSELQHAIVRLLAGPRPNLFMVGDEDQSIYGFRAACPQALLRFETDYPGAQTLCLEQNYRSAADIVVAAGRFIRQNSARREKNMKPVRPAGAPVRAVVVKDRLEQYRFLARLAQEGGMETAILYRDNDSALPLIDLLSRAGVPYCCRKTDSSFFTHKSVQDIVDILLFSMDPCDAVRFLRIYYKLGAPISKAAAEAAAARSRAGGQSVLDCLLCDASLSDWTRDLIRRTRAVLLQLPQEPAGKAIEMILSMGYSNYLQQRGLDENKVQILFAIGTQEKSPQSLLARLQELEALLRAGGAEQAPVLLSTIHSAKGLEFPRVILMDVADGLLPNVPPPEGVVREDALQAFEEERRLFYVGMTRAQEELLILRFKSPALRSCFSDFLFTKKPPAVKKPSVKKSRQTLQRLCGGFVPGMRVVHRLFGPGLLLSKDADGIVLIRFDHGPERRMLLRLLVDEELLRAENGN